VRQLASAGRLTPEAEFYRWALSILDKQEMVLTPSQARAFYDRFGRKQDVQAFYEDAALDDLIAMATFGQAESIFEFGCGTGRLASRLLAKHLPRSASYFGIDISKTMIDIADQRLSAYAERARVALSDGSLSFPLPDQSVDRVVSTYVLDLLSENDIRHVISEASRVLTPNGKLCLVSLTRGRALVSRVVSGLWSVLFRFYAPMVGGCRPIQIEPFIRQQRWAVEHHRVITRFGVPSEILIASPEGTPNGACATDATKRSSG
jgi:ubiquinone/menaquinone biosynthesis C-methylase UbiE